MIILRNILFSKKPEKDTPKKTRIGIGWLQENMGKNEAEEIFGDINGCEFDGPNSIIKEGWQEICYYEGYHFVCKDEYAEKFREFFDGWNSSRIVINGIYDIAKSNIVK